MNEWIGAAIAAMVGIVGGGVLRTVAVRAIGKEGRPEALRSSAGALGSLVFSLAVIAGLLVALGIIDPDSLEQLPEDLIAFAPKAISAAVLVIGANIAAAFATAALDRSLAGMPARARRRVTSGVRVALLGAAGLLAAGQLVRILLQNRCRIAKPDFSKTFMSFLDSFSAPKADEVAERCQEMAPDRFQWVQSADSILKNHSNPAAMDFG